MKTKKFLFGGIIISIMMVFNAGCAAIGTALAAGTAYGIYELMKGK